MKLNILLLTTLITFSVLISSNSCKKPNNTNTEEQLPPETHTGVYTFGCKVDGKIYTANGKGGLLASQYVKFNTLQDSTINVFISNTNSKFNLDFTIKYTAIPSICLAKEFPNIASFQDNAASTISGSSNFYETDNINVGRINIKYLIGSSSPMNGVSGTFEMRAKNAQNKVIHITEGRFDIGL